MKKYYSHPQNPEQKQVMERILWGKYEGWKYEDEVRAHCALEESEGGNYYRPSSQDLDLKEVILGVRCRIEGGYVKGLTLGKVRVIRAALDSNEFKIVEAR